MKLEKCLDELNSFERNSFLKIITSIIEPQKNQKEPKNYKAITAILSSTDKDFKNMDNLNVAKVFALIEDEFIDYIASELVEVTSQLDIIIDILVRDGNCILTREWFYELYKKEIISLDKKLKEFKTQLQSDKSVYTDKRKRDYTIYLDCLKKAYTNDEEQGRECRITGDEQSILNTLSKGLGLSQEEIKLINYSIIGLNKLEVDALIKNLKDIGIIFYKNKPPKIFVPDEIVRTLRKARGKEVADKYLRRVLKLLREPQINLICKNHSIDWKGSIDNKIKHIINEGISLTDILTTDIFKEDVNLTQKKTFLNDLVEKGLKITHLKGLTLEEKINNLIDYFEQVEKDEKIGISNDGYDKLLTDLSTYKKSLAQIVKSSFQLQEDDVLQSNLLIDYNIKPRDILDLLNDDDLKSFCEKQTIKTRGQIALNIRDKYKDAGNLYIENYDALAKRDYAVLKENGIQIKEAEIGVKFEQITKKIFSKLGFNVDETVRKRINTAKNKIDILLNIENNELIIIECKTSKEPGFNKFSSVSRQIKSYIELAKSKGHRVIKTLLIAPEFSQDFQNECREAIDMNLSLMTAETLINILEGLKKSKHDKLPYQLLMKDVLISEEWVLKAIKK
ncbi:MAG: restriction endonuclease [Calditrichaeota bacterium]|nr:restriction endonuclease [Calditrichota bacterium]